MRRQQVNLIEPSPIGLGFPGLDLEAEAPHLALPQELHAVVPALRIDVVPPAVQQAHLLRDIAGTALPCLITAIALEEDRQMRRQNTIGGRRGTLWGRRVIRSA